MLHMHVVCLDGFCHEPPLHLPVLAPLVGTAKVPYNKQTTSSTPIITPTSVRSLAQASTLPRSFLSAASIRCTVAHLSLHHRSLMFGLSCWRWSGCQHLHHHCARYPISIDRFIVSSDLLGFFWLRTCMLCALYYTSIPLGL